MAQEPFPAASEVSVSDIVISRVSLLVCCYKVVVVQSPIRLPEGLIGAFS
jgi:hypothetical protein